MKKLLGSALVAGLFVAGSVLAIAAPASAADTQCSSGFYCYWNNSGYGGAFGDWSGSRGNMGIATDNVTNMNDIASSHWVRWGSAVRVYEDVSHAGRNTDFADGSKNTNLASFSGGLPFPLTWNDRISSFTKL